MVKKVFGDVPDRGDLVYMDFNPQAGHEQSGRRPAIVLSPRLFNQATGFAAICPITSLAKGYPFEIELPEGSAFQGVILTDQVKSLDWKARDLKVKGHAGSETVVECLGRISTFLSV